MPIPMKGSGGDYAPSWKPEEGDEIDGIVVRQDSNTDKWNNTYPIYTVRRISGPADGEILSNEEVSIHMAATALRRWAEEQEPQIANGDRVAIKYEGRIQKKDGSGFFFGYAKGIERAVDVPAHLKVTGPTTEQVAAAANEAQADEPW